MSSSIDDTATVTSVKDISFEIEQVCHHEELVSEWSQIENENFKQLEAFLVDSQQVFQKFVLMHGQTLEQFLITLFPLNSSNKNNNNNHNHINFIQSWNHTYQHELSQIQKEVLRNRIFHLTTTINKNENNDKNNLHQIIILHLRQHHITSCDTAIRILPLIHQWLLVTDDDQQLTERISTKLISKFIKFCSTTVMMMKNNCDDEVQDQKADHHLNLLIDSFFDHLKNNSSSSSALMMTKEEFLIIKNYLSTRQRERSSALMLLAVLVTSNNNDSSSSSSSSLPPLLSLLYQHQHHQNSSSNNNNYFNNNSSSAIRPLLRDIVVDNFDLYELAKSSSNSIKTLNLQHQKFVDSLFFQQKINNKNNDDDSLSDVPLLTPFEVRMNQAKLSFFLLLQSLSSFSCYPFSNQELLDLNTSIGSLGKL